MLEADAWVLSDTFMLDVMIVEPSEIDFSETDFMLSSFLLVCGVLLFTCDLLLESVAVLGCLLASFLLSCVTLCLS
ncbi:hypothetical protein HK407_08g13270 [Ordospora pajunii]|uniref:uncharacterized protein n=1 Tax=Ordospora pajunii TaxID=3039483 RepID=UPI00295285AF|nr:uncharacterized protein HK407_08g13270 [Ordospora pajunii]KAH9411053.1 hypothetical protein HK407_08g13270 [Ordospora pajunii]